MIAIMKNLRISRVEAFPTSFPVKQGVTLGIGRAVKRDCVIVKVVTEGGLVGWGESHHGRCPGAIGQLINTTLRQLVIVKVMKQPDIRKAVEDQGSEPIGSTPEEFKKFIDNEVVVWKKLIQISGAKAD